MTCSWTGNQQLLTGHINIRNTTKCVNRITHNSPCTYSLSKYVLKIQFADWQKTHVQQMPVHEIEAIPVSQQPTTSCRCCWEQLCGCRTTSLLEQCWHQMQQHFTATLSMKSPYCVRASSNITVGQSSLISLTHHCYDWHPGSRCGWTCNQLTSKVDGGITGSWLRWSILT